MQEMQENMRRLALGVIAWGVLNLVVAAFLSLPQVERFMQTVSIKLGLVHGSVFVNWFCAGPTLARDAF